MDQLHYSLLSTKIKIKPYSLNTIIKSRYGMPFLLINTPRHRHIVSYLLVNTPLYKTYHALPIVYIPQHRHVVSYSFINIAHHRHIVPIVTRDVLSFRVKSRISELVLRGMTISIDWLS